MAFFARLLGLAASRRPDGLERGTALLRAGRIDEAAELFDAALASALDDRRRALARNKRALILLARHDRAGAADELTTALALHAACVPALVNFANLRLEAGAIEDAVERYRAAIALDPEYAEAHHNLGVAYKRLGRKGDAVRSLRRATGLEARRKKS